MKCKVHVPNNVVPTYLRTLACSVLAGSLLFAQQASPPAAYNGNLALVDTPVLIPDESGNATTILHFRSSGGSAKVALSLSDFEHLRTTNNASNPPKPYSLGTTVLLSGLSSEDQKLIDSGTLDAGKMLAVKLTVAHLWEAGASKARIYNGGFAMPGPDGKAEAVVKAVRIPLQYNIELLAKGDPPEIHFKGKQGQVQLKNLDPMNYDFYWELRVGDQTKGGWTELPANSVTTIDLSSAAPSVPWFGGLLKETRQDADFFLRPAFEDVHQPAASRTFAVKVRESWAGPFQEFVNLCFVIALLALGGTVSIWINWGMPNTTRALAIRKQLWAAQTKLNGTGELISAKWRVILAAQLEWILREMKSSLWVFPAFSTTLDAIEIKTKLLEEWIDIAYDVAVIREQVQLIQQRQRMPPTLLHLVEQKCDHALEPLETGHTNVDELRAMHLEISGAQALLAATSGPDQILEQEITDRETLLLACIDSLRERFAADFGNLIDDFKRTAGTPLKRAFYTDRDTISQKILILSEFGDCVRRATGAAPAGEFSVSNQVAARLEKYRPRLFDYLRTDGYESLCMAREFLEEMHQDIYPEAMEAELVPEPRLSIMTEPRVIAPGAPVRCTLLFTREALNDAIARQEWTCVWEFGDGSQPRTGWAVFHTFPEHGSFNVQVKLHGLDARPIEHKPIGTVLRVDPPRRRTGQPTESTSITHKAFRILRLSKPHAETMLEASRLALVLAAAVFGLIAAAQDKIRDLTFLEAAGALFALGFGADTLKNLMLHKS